MTATGYGSISLADQEAQIRSSELPKLGDDDFTFADLLPLSAGEQARLVTRWIKLDRVEAEANKAGQKLAGLSTPNHLRVRWQFVARADLAVAPGDPSDRRIPKRRDRPPATRLVSPRGIALRLYLTALFLGQTRPAGDRPGNDIPLDDDDETSWVDLIATPAERSKAGGLTYSGIRIKKLRQLQDALRRLASADVQLVELPQFKKRPTVRKWPNGKKKPIGKYESFLLLNERGAPEDGTTNERYRVPTEDVRTVLQLPAGLFLNGWIHVLEDSELTFLLMLACLRARYGDNKPLFLAGETRLLQFGLSRDAYESHRLLERLGLVDVTEDENRHFGESRVRGFKRTDDESADAANAIPKVHRFQLLDDGFDQQAIPAMRSAIKRRVPHVKALADAVRRDSENAATTTPSND